MTAVAEFVPVEQFTNTKLVNAIVSSTRSAFEMCGLNLRLAGVVNVPVGDGGQVTGLIGVHGRVSGFASLNLSERLSIRAVDGLLQESFDRLTNQVIDGVGEITNIITGGIKASLATSEWSFPSITTPTVIVGNAYRVAHARGLEYISALFDCDDGDILLDDRIVRVSLSLLRI